MDMTDVVKREIYKPFLELKTYQYIKTIILTITELSSPALVPGSYANLKRNSIKFSTRLLAMAPQLVWQSNKITTIKQK